MTPVPLGKRLLAAVAAAIATSIFVMLGWSLLGFAIAGSMHGKQSETVGYDTIVLAPMGAFAAFLSAFALGFPPFGARPWLRWVVNAGVFLALGVVSFVLLARG